MKWEQPSLLQVAQRGYYKAFIAMPMLNQRLVPNGIRRQTPKLMTAPALNPLLDIRRPEEIDAAWMTQALQSAGIDAVVASVSARPVGTGQIGDSVRFTLSYERGADEAPASLVGKFPAADPKSFQAGVNGGNYAREVRFYQRLAASAGISTPICHFAEIDEKTGAFALLFEDLAPAEQGDQLTGVTLNQAGLVVEEAAKLHASHWGDESLEAEAWLVGSRAAPPSPLPPEKVRELWNGFRDRYADQLNPRTLEVGSRLAERIVQFRELNNGSRCVIHSDFRPDNMMFATAAGGRPITVLDWQSVGLGAGPLDLGYFLAGALPLETRRKEEKALLTRYHEGLLRGGVTGYNQAALQRDYAAGGLRLLMIAFVSSMRVKQTSRGDAMFMQMARAATDHAFDNEALALLD
jgi:hypothetical protein